jgi:phosphoglucomutase
MALVVAVGRGVCYQRRRCQLVRRDKALGLVLLRAITRAESMKTGIKYDVRNGGPAPSQSPKQFINRRWASRSTPTCDAYLDIDREGSTTIGSTEVVILIL